MPDEKRNEKQEEMKGKSTHTSDTREEEPKEDKQEEVSEKEDKGKDRTKKEFEKLTKSNKELKKKTTEYESVLDSLRPQQQPQQQPQQPPARGTSQVPDASRFQNLQQEQIDDVFAGMMDKEGYLDGNKLMSKLRDMDRRASEAEVRAQRAEMAAQQMVKSQRDFEETQAVKKVHNKYPQLDPQNEEFNGDFFDDVRNETISQMINGKLDFEAAADKVFEKHYKPREEEEMATKKQKEEAESKEDAKKQINATNVRSSAMKGYYESTELKSLKEDVMKGKKGALAERLRRSGY